MSAATFMRTGDVIADASRAGMLPGRRSVEVVENHRLADGIYRLTFRDEYMATTALPAQFVDLYPPNPRTLMPRPFGVAQVEGDLVSLIFAVVGEGTAEFAQLGPGSRVEVLGPLGHAFDLDAAAHYVLVGGGLGVPPLLYAAQHLAGRDDAETTAVFGYRDERFADAFAEHHCDRTFSITNAEGNVVDLLNRLEGMLISGSRPPVLLSCGPMPMMRAVAAWATRRDLPCQLSLEARMSCGYGACVACVVDTATGRRRVCFDGPVFTPQQLGWQA